ncbi:Predicted membrane protein [Pseudoxanthomonas sp. GM95]|uniref:DUF2069 domain-containing protein n=1 Tax=Pseudoxanthomonas sp. GM95 TaxID=1881043 RepID=UPI0008CBD479|nr:DUF2069 domain-containing protein [Pseudoxanthomonas sp. GM95]SEK60353.1 Predicted membrane protein [Pseudoxanthomonas sp. GM95]
MSAPRTPRPLLAIGLLALSALFGWWFRDDRHYLATLLVFTLPPLVLAIGARLGSRLAAFWTGVLGLGWFSHGVMTAWTHPEVRLYGWIELVLALTVIFAANWTGLRAKLGRKRQAGAAAPTRVKSAPDDSAQ